MGKREAETYLTQDNTRDEEIVDLDAEDGTNDDAVCFLIIVLLICLT